MHNGYSMCSNALDDLYASHPLYMSASSIVHEIMHPYGDHGNYDHFGSPQCDEIMGWGNKPFNREESALYNNLCPYVYDRFVANYNAQ